MSPNAEELAAQNVAGLETDWRHPGGILEIPKGVVACYFCGNTRFRRSRMRLGDLKEFLLLRFPVRCMRCNQRQYQQMMTAAIARPVKNYGPQLAKGQDTWKNWTEREMGGRMHRPMTTALGPRATKLASTQHGVRVARDGGAPRPEATRPGLPVQEEERQGSAQQGGGERAGESYTSSPQHQGRHRQQDIGQAAGSHEATGPGGTGTEAIRPDRTGDSEETRPAWRDQDRQIW